MAWNNKTNNTKTWANFQAHFRKAYRDLKQVRALNIQNSTIAHATMVDEIKKHNTETMQNISETLRSSIYDTVNLITNDQETEQLTANAVTIQSLQKEIMDLKNIVAQLTTNQTQLQVQPRSKKKPRKYCWTHGWCAHAGAECNMKAEGHKDEATLQDRMGGSNRFCPQTK